MAVVKWEILIVNSAWGKFSKAALQHFLKRTGHYTRECDGSFGYYSQLALQKWLKARKSSGGPYYSGRLDGDAGDMTWEALGQLLAYWGRFSQVPSPWWKGASPSNYSAFRGAIHRWLNAERAG